MKVYWSWAYITSALDMKMLLFYIFLKLLLQKLPMNAFVSLGVLVFQICLHFLSLLQFYFDFSLPCILYFLIFLPSFAYHGYLEHCIIWLFPYLTHLQPLLEVTHFLNLRHKFLHTTFCLLLLCNLTFFSFSFHKSLFSVIFYESFWVFVKKIIKT